MCGTVASENRCLGYGIVSARARKLTPRWATTNLLPGSDGERTRIYRGPPVSTRQCRRPEDGEDCKRVSLMQDRKERMLAYQPFDSSLESPTRSAAGNGSCRFEIEVNRDALTTRCAMRDRTSSVIKGERLKYISQIGIPPGLSKR